MTYDKIIKDLMSKHLISPLSLPKSKSEDFAALMRVNPNDAAERERLVDEYKQLVHNYKEGKQPEDDDVRTAA